MSSLSHVLLLQFKIVLCIFSQRGILADGLAQCLVGVVGVTQTGIQVVAAVA